ncbi:MAG: hypothetical protein H7X95_01590 [Deltaproteobacteria bacterium]|nr:hypothetical protein [Deltaproteobacteria bacterium]
MFRLIKFLLGVAGLVLFVWFGANVPLGTRTLFEHLQAIGRTRETQDLFDGTRDSAKPLLEGVRKRLGAAAAAGDEPKTARAAVDAGAPPADEISSADRQRLRKVLGTGHASR